MGRAYSREDLQVFREDKGIGVGGRGRVKGGIRGVGSRRSKGQRRYVEYLVIQKEERVKTSPG